MLRLTGGEWNGRELQTLDSDATRPTSSKVRQALMNSLQFELQDSKILDLFSGSGALSFEALSRGASFSLMIEKLKPAVSVIQKNVRTLDVRLKTRVIEGDVFRSLAQAEGFGPFDFVFADPPYALGYEEKLLGSLSWEKLLKQGGVFILEWGRQKSQMDQLPDQIGILTKVREKTYGDSVLSSYRRE